MIFENWARRHRISDDAIKELRYLLHAASVPEFKHKEKTSEAGVQQAERIKAAECGIMLWRNNNGALQNSRGDWVRYGLGNDSKKINNVMKSSDLIGINPVRVTEFMVGKVIGQFVAVECKEPGWTFNPNNEHEQAQWNFITLVNQLGGEGRFAS